MSNAARFSFRPAIASLCLALAAPPLGGCTTASGVASLETVTAQSDPQVDFASIRIPVPAKAPNRPEGPKLDRMTTASSVPVKPAPKSQWCRYIAADAGAEASILRSPTLSASASDGGSKSVGLGLNLVDLAKADEIERAAKLRCEQKVSEGSLAAMVLIANQTNTSLGASAKAAYLGGVMGKLSGIERQTHNLLAIGDLTAAEASMIAMRIARLNQAYSDSKSDAARLQAASGAEELIQPDAASRLRGVEDELQRSNARMRTLNAMSVNVETGWTRKDEALLAAASGDGRFYGKVSVGVRLGALSPSRLRLEEEARIARVAALDEAYTGIIWQSDRAGRTMDDSRKNLMSSRSAVSSALDNTYKTLRALRGSDRIELASTRLAAEVDAIMMQSELAAIDASLDALKKNSELTMRANN